MVNTAANVSPQAPKLKGKGKIPLFALPSTAGGTSGPGALRSKYNVVLVFVDGTQAAEGYLTALSGVYSSILASQARLLVVVPHSIDGARSMAQRLSLLFSLLADPGGETTRRMLGEGSNAALCVTDRYGQVFYLEVAPTSTDLSVPQSALDWLEFIQIQCPE